MSTQHGTPAGASGDEQAAAVAALREFAAGAEVPLEPGARAGEFVLVLPGEHKLRTVCSVLVGAREVSVSAFVIRHPDENHEAFFRALLQRNLRTPGLAFAIDDHDDVYVTGRIPLAAATAQTYDGLLGVLLQSADGMFDELLRLGFLTSMKREWAWRVARGESLRNLEAFRALLEGSERDPGYAVADGTGAVTHTGTARAAAASQVLAAGLPTGASAPGEAGPQAADEGDEGPSSAG